MRSDRDKPTTSRMKMAHCYPRQKTKTMTLWTGYSVKSPSLTWHPSNLKSIR